ncbi:MAG TPA: Gfo/Idh/MocA family oxidoreductase [Armatimonadota bacterium]|nr:Gfo/Idh/MocA family oxidoreductase [Armatimonadota bacterium]
MDQLNWGILGTGNIARTFAKAVQNSETGVLTAVGSRTQEAADKFGKEFGINRRYGSYAAILEDPEVQAVYISLPNHLHAEWGIKCAQAEKHILCEKPLTVNHAEAMRLVDEVDRNHVFLMEAFMYRCHPQTQKLKEILKSGAIGDVRLIQSNFCYNMGPKYENIRLSNPAAGGGIMDVGCYTMSMARLIAGADPIDVKGSAFIGPVSRVDEQATASVLFPGGIVANLACATQVSADNELRIWGSAGSIRVPNPWFPGERGNRILVQKTGDDKPTEVVVNGGAGLYSIEADTVARNIENFSAPPPCMTWLDSLGNMAALDKWRKSVKLVFDVEKGRRRG